MDSGAYVFLENNLCVQNCPDGQYEDADNSSCEDCAPGCATCDGPSLLECHTCTEDTDSSTPYYKVLGVSQCDTECPNGQFISSTYDYECEYCSVECGSCVGTLHNCTTTLECTSRYYYFNDTFECLGVCPDGYYAN